MRIINHFPGTLSSTLICIQLCHTLKIFNIPDTVKCWLFFKKVNRTDLVWYSIHNLLLLDVLRAFDGFGEISKGAYSRLL